LHKQQQHERSHPAHAELNFFKTGTDHGSNRRQMHFKYSASGNVAG
jgi:hypothetical protein